MAEYIDRDAAIAACFDGFADCRDDCAANIRNLPAADVVERKTGKWEVDEVGCGICSACGNFAFETTTHHISGWYPRFCPNCGAKMEVPTDV